MGESSRKINRKEKPLSDLCLKFLKRIKLLIFVFIVGESSQGVDRKKKEAFFRFIFRISKLNS